MDTPLKRETFIQINIVVQDIQKAAVMWGKILGIEPPKIRKTHLESMPEYQYSYRGKETPCDLLVCDIPMGQFVIELHQPVGGESSFQEFLEKHGNGVHHLGFEVGDNRDEVLQGIRDLGLSVERTVGYYPGSSWTIVDSEDVLGVNLNIKPVR